MNTQLARRKLRWSSEHRGLGGTVRATASTLYHRVVPRPRPAPSRHPWDTEHGTDTSGLLGGGSLAIGHRHDTFIVGYAGVPPSRFRALLERWQATLDGVSLESVTFIDLGCGKGRALMLATELPFREAIGVELNPELAACAERNLTLWSAAGKAHCPTRVVAGDVTEFAWPAGPVLVFIYNSFAPPVTRGVLDSLAKRAATDPSRLDIVYQNESETTPLRGDERLALQWAAVLPMTPGDAEADPAASQEDRTVAYRWIA